MRTYVSTKWQLMTRLSSGPELTEQAQRECTVCTYGYITLEDGEEIECGCATNAINYARVQAMSKDELKVELRSHGVDPEVLASKLANADQCVMKCTDGYCGEWPCPGCNEVARENLRKQDADFERYLVARDGTTSQQMHEDLKREPKTPGLPHNLTITHSLPEICEVDEATHRTAYKAATGHFWPGQYNPWVFQFIRVITLAQHQQWMARLYERGTDSAGMVLQTMIVQDLLDGRERPKFRKKVETGVAFGTGDDGIDWGGDDSGVDFGAGGWE